MSELKVSPAVDKEKQPAPEVILSIGLALILQRREHSARFGKISGATQNAPLPLTLNLNSDCEQQNLRGHTTSQVGESSDD